jgi:hypothetical protein
MRLLLICVLLAASCGDDENAAFAHYFAAKPYDDNLCNIADGKLPFRREVRLYTYGNADVPPYTRALQKYYRRYGLTFYGTQPVTTIPERYIINGDSFALNEKLQQEFPGVNTDDQESLRQRDPALYERVVRFTMNFLFGPVIEFARMHGNLGLGVTNFAVVPEVLRPGGSGLLGTGDEVAGLSVSPALIAALVASKDPAAAGWKTLDLPPDFTPMMFLNGSTLGLLESAKPDLVDLVAAHEFGHTCGLIHREEEHNLMLPAVDPTTSACTDSLDPDQLDTMRASLSAAPAKALTLATSENPPVFPPAELRALQHGDRAALLRLLRQLR